MQTIIQPNRASRRALRLPAVVAKTGLSKTQIYRLIQRGQFPPSHKISDRVAVFDEAAIDTWLDEKFASGESK